MPDPKAALGASDPPKSILEGRKVMAQAARDLAAAEKWSESARRFWLDQEAQIQAACPHAEWQDNPDDTGPELYRAAVCCRCLKPLGPDEVRAGTKRPPAKRG